MRAALPPTSPRPRARRGRRAPGRFVAVAVAAATLAVGVVGVGAVQAAPPTTDPATSATYGARWLAAQYDPAGFVPTATDTPDVGATLDGTLALAAAGVEEDTFDASVAWLQANVTSVIDGGADGDIPQRIGLLLVIADAAGVDPTSFGGADLPALLLATEGAYEPGLFGGALPFYDGSFRQSLAILGLVASGTPVPASARAWLVDQQCDAPAEVAGGWQAYRADLAAPCLDALPSSFDRADTNGTAVAVQALLADGGFAGSGAALDFLERAQEPDGGFSLFPGNGSDPNSTALVIQAVVAAGEDPTSGRWAAGTPSPVSTLLAWQIGCDADPLDRGAFTSPYVVGGLPDPFATRQAVWGVAERPFPLDGPVSFTAAAAPCVPPTTTTTTTTAPTTTTTSGPSSTTSTTAPRSAAAVAVVVQPVLAG